MKKSAAIALLFAAATGVSAEPPGGKHQADGSILYEIRYGSVRAGSDGTIELVLPNSKYKAAMKLEGFRIGEVNSKPEGIMFVTDVDTGGFIVSGYLEKAKVASAIGCREFYFTYALSTPTAKQDVARHERGVLAIGEYLIAEVKGRKIRQYHRNIYAFAESYCLDLHISKVLFEKAADMPLVESLTATVGMKLK